MQLRISSLVKTVSAAAALAFISMAQPALAADAEVSLVIKDHLFTPNPLEIPADTKVKVTLENRDQTTAEFMSDDFKGGKLVTGGKTVSFFIGPLKAGTYEFHDEYKESISKARLIVK
ncbi:MAG: cupredoxin domain-containing protein [Pseudomonas sp.]|jgi:heme/copper-type cytochrome/quinol oxidase subunit 2